MFWIGLRVCRTAASGECGPSGLFPHPIRPDADLDRRPRDLSLLVTTLYSNCHQTVLTLAASTKHAHIATPPNHIRAECPIACFFMQRMPSGDVSMTYLVQSRLNGSLPAFVTSMVPLIAPRTVDLLISHTAKHGAPPTTLHCIDAITSLAYHRENII
jgi:hypothetical protein